MKAFVTGGSGFIGRVVVRRLVERGYHVVALARSDQSAGALAELGAQVVRGDISDVASMRSGMAGSDVVFHLAGWNKIGGDDWQRAEPTNVGGTRKVLRLAHELGVPHIVYVSTVTVFGNTNGELVDETYRAGGPFLSEYDRTKWLAHYQVAMPMIEKGAPIIIVMPGGVYGPGDQSLVGEMMAAFYRGQTPLVPAPETTLTYTHVEDVAAGIILAAEKGKVGESYILAGPAIPLGEMVDFWGHLTGRRPPLLRIPADWIRPLAPVASFLERFVSLPALYSHETFSLLGTSYGARSDKARAELGWETRTLQAGMLETFRHIAQTNPAPVAPGPTTTASRERQAAWLGLVAAIVLFVAWLRGRGRAGSTA